MAVKCLVVGLVVKVETQEAEGIGAGPLSPVVVGLQRAVEVRWKRESQR